jgi:hypothetical protein
MIEYHTEHLIALLEEMEKELKKNELFLKQTNNFYSHHQDEPYRRLYGLLHEAKQTAKWIKQE